MAARRGPRPRSTYRHGDLRRALLEAAVDLARKGGPEAVVLREATRRAGVAPNAAYRHFAGHGALLQAVRAAALARVAEAMEQELAALRPMRGAEVYARASLRAVGTAYLAFAQAEPGLFRTAFMAPPADAPRDEAAMAGKTGMNPFQIVGMALDRMVAAGVLAPERRPGAEYLAWSAVHGLAMLVIDGPLRRFDAKERQAVGQRVIDMVEHGL